MPTLKIHLRDRNPKIVKAWRQEFGDEDAVQISQGEMLDVAADAIVSPANSFGYMDGGIDLAYSNFFGWNLQEKLRKLLGEQHHGELPVGQAVIVDTSHELIRYLVSAPTMRVPGNVAATTNVYLAFRAALIAVAKHNDSQGLPIRSLLVPGMGTGVGGMPEARAARQMKIAYCAVVKGGSIRFQGAADILTEHRNLLL